MIVFLHQSSNFIFGEVINLFVLFAQLNASQFFADETQWLRDFIRQHNSNNHTGQKKDQIEVDKCNDKSRNALLQIIFAGKIRKVDITQIISSVIYNWFVSRKIG